MEDKEIFDTHDDVECCLVMPDGQLKSINTCWCKLYHIFGDLEQENTLTEKIKYNGDEVFCMYLSDNILKTNLQARIPNIVLERRLFKKIYGPGIFFQKGKPVTNEDVRKILMFQN
jgi:hypothetical protein